MSREHPTLGHVDVMPPWLQPMKTWRHFYSPVEDWKALAGVDTQRLYDAARASGCPEWYGQGAYPRFPRGCVAKLREHHDAHYAPVYMRELFAPDTKHAQTTSDSKTKRWVSVSTNGVYVVCGDGPDAPVITAYRPHRPGLRVPPSLKHFHARALERWHKETGMPRSDLQDRLAQVVRDADDAWILAMAIAEARAAGGEALRPSLEQATQRFKACPQALREALRPEPEPLLGRLDDALQGEEPDVAGVLLELEESLALSELIDGEAAAQRLGEAAGRLLDWAPPEWSRLQRLAADRAARCAGAAQEMWEDLHAQVLAASLAEAKPLTAPRATLAAALVQQQREAEPVTSPALAPLLDAAWRLTQQRARRAQAGLDRLLAGLTLGQPSVVMNQRDSAPPWSIHAAAQRAEGARVFVVDADYPDGYEITEYLQGAEAEVWRLERPGQEAVVIALRGAPEGGALRELLQRAEAEGVEVALRRFTRPR
ncbi:MAG: hypothetical protein H6741_10740 [Alphaproteobacteria bacterium]|nr:hypothetical protein [Alphaproteobacteria bacterium]